MNGPVENVGTSKKCNILLTKDQHSKRDKMLKKFKF